MRRALCLVLVAAASCGDSSAKPVPPPGEPAPTQHDAPAAPPAPEVDDAPFEATFDDQALASLVSSAARKRNSASLAALKLPPRCDRVRVAVRLFHEELSGTRKDSVPLDVLFAALGELAQCEGGASAKSLGPLVVAWRAWTDADRAAERELSRRASAALAVLRGSGAVDPATLAATIAGAPSAPPKSPAAAILAFVRAAQLVFANPEHRAVGQDVQDAYDHALKRFEDLGWPGGFGSLADGLARRLLREDPASFVAQHLADYGQAAYAGSGDELRASLAFLPMADAAEARGELKRAEFLADGARLRIARTAARGRELFDVLRRHGELAQMLGRQADAARDLSHALEEANWAHLDVASRVAVAERYATTLFLLGRFAEAYDLATGAARLHDEAVARGMKEFEPARTGLDEVAAQAAWELGRAADSARHYLAASARYEKRIAGDDPRWVRGYGTTLALGARGQWKAGDAAGAAKTLGVLLARDDLGPSARAEAASVLREMKRFDDAEWELARAEKEGGPQFAEALSEERGRLAVARGDTAGARELFRRALDRLTQRDPNALVGWDAARVLMDWARMEATASRLFEASELAGQAIVQLNGAGLAVELDRARELYARLQRQRLWFEDAAKVTAQRVDSGPPGDAARCEEALLDLLLVRIELLVQRQKDAEKNALAAAELFAEGWRRDAARRMVDAARRPSEAAALEIPADAAPRWTLVRDVLALKQDDFDGTYRVCAKCGADEPELRRWAASKFRHGAHPWAHEFRRRADIAKFGEMLDGIADDEEFVSIEPYGDHLEVCSMTRGHAELSHVDGDGGLAAFRDATLFEPAKLADAAKRVAAYLQPGDNVRRLVLSVPEPYGPLPFDVVPSGDGTLLDRCEVVVVPSLTEFLRARDGKRPPLLATLPSPYATLDERHAIVQIGTPTNEVRARLFQHLAAAETAGKDRSAALRAAKLKLRDEWNPGVVGHAEVPAWAAFVLRGAP